MIFDVFILIMIPFLGTSLGATMVFLLKKEINSIVNKLLLGFASGVMIAASIWSLIIPAIEMSDDYGVFKFIPAAVGFAAGIAFLSIIDKILPHLHASTDSHEGIKTKKIKNTWLMVLAVTLHNIPEGMALGVVVSSIILGDGVVAISAAFALAIGIAIQNFPEGVIVSLPLKGEGLSTKKSWLFGILSGIVEPIAALITIALSTLISALLPYLLCFAAGAMIYVVSEELIPQAKNNDSADYGTIGLAIGFIVMMILDVTLG